MPGSDKRRLGESIRAHTRNVESHPLVTLGNGSQPVEAPGHIDHSRRNTGDLIPALLPPSNLPAKALEGRHEERGHVAGLKATFAGQLHAVTNLCEIEGAEHFGVECALG